MHCNGLNKTSILQFEFVMLNGKKILGMFFQICLFKIVNSCSVQSKHQIQVAFGRTHYGRITTLLHNENFSSHKH